MAFEIEPREAFLPLADIDPYVCNLRLRAISAGDRDEIAYIFRLVPDQVYIVGIPPGSLPAVGGDTTSDNSALIRKVIEAQCEVLRVANRGSDFAGCAGSAARVAMNALRRGNYLELADNVARAGALSSLSAMRDRCWPHLNKLFPDFAARTIPRHRRGRRSTRCHDSQRDRKKAERLLRVGEAKVEALVNLAGELVVAKNALAHTAKRVEEEFGDNDIARSIQRDRDAIDWLVTELHGTILQLRMVPVGQLFRSFPRLIRDIARQLDKNVTLVTRGETTEADKTIVDRLFEPMVHLVRNALDHGIESPGQRRAAGKSEGATVSISAFQVADRLVIEVTDDGRGIDPEAVRRKASEMRILPPDELAALSAESVVDLVFPPVFRRPPPYRIFPVAALGWMWSELRSSR